MRRGTSSTVAISPRYGLLLGFPVQLLEGNRLGTAAGNVAGDLAGVEAAVLDEPAVRLVAAADRPGQVQAGPLGLERRVVVDRRPCRILAERDAEPLAECEVGSVPGECQHPLVRQ